MGAKCKAVDCGGRRDRMRVAGDGGAALLRLRFGTTRDAVASARRSHTPEDRLPVAANRS